MPNILRDAQVLPVWEGTTNVLSLDTQRAVFSTGGQAQAVFERVVRERLAALPARANEVRQCLETRMEGAFAGLKNISMARDTAMTLARVYAASCLAEQWHWSGKEEDEQVFFRFCGGNQETVDDPRWLGGLGDSVRGYANSMAFPKL